MFYHQPPTLLFNIVISTILELVDNIMEVDDTDN